MGDSIPLSERRKSSYFQRPTTDEETSTIRPIQRRRAIYHTLAIIFTFLASAVAVAHAIILKLNNTPLMPVSSAFVYDSLVSGIVSTDLLTLLFDAAVLVWYIVMFVLLTFPIKSKYRLLSWLLVVHVVFLLGTMAAFGFAVYFLFKKVKEYPTLKVVMFFVVEMGYIVTGTVFAVVCVLYLVQVKKGVVRASTPMTTGTMTTSASSTNPFIGSRKNKRPVRDEESQFIAPAPVKEEVVEVKHGYYEPDVPYSTVPYSIVGTDATIKPSSDFHFKHSGPIKPEEAIGG
ncbi:hypothetical protein HK098_003438 [Nowakowskiella sp. JEL0407]|nr:hypothetical protein HK098_003438 [Nowakowskiella sp. JEL0407]